MKLEISIRIKVNETDDLQQRLYAVLENLKAELWAQFGDVMQVDNEPPVTVAWSEIKPADTSEPCACPVPGFWPSQPDTCPTCGKAHRERKQQRNKKS